MFRIYRIDGVHIPGGKAIEIEIKRFCEEGLGNALGQFRTDYTRALSNT
jgi:hypothetical protein